MASALPDDMLADVLGRLPPRTLAACRCVCAAWRAAIDARRLLRPEDLLPLSLAGVLVNYTSNARRCFAQLFSRPGSKKLVGCFRYPPLLLVLDHCNGLLLVLYCNGLLVINPATGRRTALPELPRPAHAGAEDFWQDMYLVFDPAVSSSFQVFLVPRVPSDRTRQGLNPYGNRTTYLRARQTDAALLRSRWPLSPCVLNVFSSATGRWEQRAFHRDGDGDGDGEGAGTVADLQKHAHLFTWRRNAVYFRGALYVHCESDFVMRISLSTNRYHMIKPPPPTVICKFRQLHLGKSENGIYFALLGDEAQLWVWILAETNNGQAEWVLRHATGAGLLLPSLNCIERFRAPWMLRQIAGGKDDQDAPAERNEYQWNSDNDEEGEEIILHNNEDNGQTRCCQRLGILAFHPYKEILFLRRSMSRGLAYHLNSSKLEDLGDLSPNKRFIDSIGACFPYTPCWI